MIDNGRPAGAKRPVPVISRVRFERLCELGYAGRRETEKAPPGTVWWYANDRGAIVRRVGYIAEEQTARVTEDVR